MRTPISPWPVVAGLAAAAMLAGSAVSLRAQDGFRFKSGVELVNVNVTVTDRTGRFVSGLRQEDFAVFGISQSKIQSLRQKRS
jgi:hypothetical protein